YTVTNGVPGPGAGNIETPGTHDIYTFTAAAGQKVYFQLLGGSPGLNVNWRVVDQAGNQLFNDGIPGNDPGVYPLNRGGTYTIDVGWDYNTTTGTYSFALLGQGSNGVATFDLG